MTACVGKIQKHKIIQVKGMFYQIKALKVFFYCTMSINMLQRHSKCHGMCNVKMCKYRQHMNCDENSRGRTKETTSGDALCFRVDLLSALNSLASLFIHSAALI